MKNYRRTLFFYFTIMLASCRMSSCAFNTAAKKSFRSCRHLTAASSGPSHDPDQRTHLLHKSLADLNIDITGISEAARKSVENPSGGYDGKFGRSAIRTYRSFVSPKKDVDEQPSKLTAMAQRCARQIEFLLRRHRSHQEEWVRHHDQAKEERQVFPLILLLDNLRSAFNVGSIFRTADATGCVEVLTTGITPSPHASGAEKLAKSALGAERLVSSKHFATTQEAIEYIREELPEYTIIGMETTEKSRAYTEMEYDAKGVVLVLGNEVTGLDTQIIPDLDEIIEIPMFGAKNSLNVAACAPVVLYEIHRQWDRSNIKA